MKGIFFCLLVTCGLSAYEVLGVGTVCIDHLISVEDEFLTDAPCEKGQWCPVAWDQFSEVMAKAKGAAEATIRTGGCTANTIRGLASLGTKCGLTGKLGRDEMGHYAQRQLSAMDVETFFSYTTTPTPQIACLVTPDGERSFCSFVDAEQEFCVGDLQPQHFERPKLVHLDGYLLRNGRCMECVLEMAKAAGCQVSMDLGNPRLVAEAKERLLEAMSSIDILFANAEEARALTGLDPKSAAWCLCQKCRVAVVKVGAKGCFVGSGDQLIYRPGLPTRVVDTTGAGDLFASGFLHKYLGGAELGECAEFGNRVGSRVVEVVGAQVPQSAWIELTAAR